MIPSTISREHILKAINEIDRNAVPQRRLSTKFSLVFDGKLYPPKYVISLAHRFAEGRELDSTTFNGGKECNSFVRALGFEIRGPTEKQRSSVKVSRPTKRSAPAVFTRRHNERCKDCKTAVRKLLGKLYGGVEANWRFDVPTKPDALGNTRFQNALAGIYQSLQANRGFGGFARSPILPHSDWFVTQPGFIVEFDESQHFTACRAIALAAYPEDLLLGFDRRLWLERCHKISAKDNDPPYRDEQRAWYDTLRDFLPEFLDLKPTVRLYAGERERQGGWCNLDPERPQDVQTFRQILSDRLSFWKVEVRSDSNPDAARIVIDGQWNGDVGLASRLLEHVADSWPDETRVKFLTTCGAFLTFNWPTSLPDTGNNLYPAANLLPVLKEKVEKKIVELLTARLVKKLASHTRYLTIGIDSHKSRISQTQSYIPEPHIELVCVIDLLKGLRQFTGKSYPTPGQQRGLVRYADLASHTVETEYGCVLVLGCHDLTIFNPRSRSNRHGWRKDVANGWVDSIRRDKPVIVLHHPHTTIKTRTWAAAWNELHRSLRSVELSLGAGSYSIRDEGWESRDRLDDVLQATKCGATLDFVVHIGA
jgi:hypothetical protein